MKYIQCLKICIFGHSGDELLATFKLDLWIAWWFLDCVCSFIICLLCTNDWMILNFIICFLFLLRCQLVLDHSYSIVLSAFWPRSDARSFRHNKQISPEASGAEKTICNLVENFLLCLLFNSWKLYCLLFNR